MSVAAPRRLVVSPDPLDDALLLVVGREGEVADRHVREDTVGAGEEERDLRVEDLVHVPRRPPETGLRSRASPASSRLRA